MPDLDNATRAAVLTVAMAAAEDVAIDGYLGKFQTSFMNGGYTDLFQTAQAMAQAMPNGYLKVGFAEAMVNDWRKERKAHNAT